MKKPTITQQALQYKHYFEKVCTGFTKQGDEWVAKKAEMGEVADFSFFVEINMKDDVDNILLQSGKFETVKQALEWVHTLDYVAQDECNVWVMFCVEDGDIDLLGVVDFYKVFTAANII